jgi:DNA helicase-2/ATP-dependent DNA helicase PcrA
MEDEEIKKFASSERGLVIAAAGCGKTELIAKAVAKWPSGKQLILTHTHAGVRALRDRLKKLGARSEHYKVDTIAGFAFRYSSSFPKTSRCETKEPKTEEDYKQIYESCVRALANKHICDIIQKSYSGFYVDEYQDCTKRQHAIVMYLAHLLPCRIVGDPLQGIFDFVKNDPIVDWTNDIFPNFDRLPDLTIPFRWINKNKELGAWLSIIRKKLVLGQNIDLNPYWIYLDKSFNPRLIQIANCKKLLKNKDQSVAVICKWDNQEYSLAKNLKGAYGCMEEIECRALMHFCEKLDQLKSYERVATIFEFVSQCATSFPPEIKDIYNSYKKKKTASLRLSLKYPTLITMINSILESDRISHIAAILRYFQTIPGIKLYRRELYNEMDRTLISFDQNRDNSLKSAAWRVREAARRIGRPIGFRTVSRTLLIKGLEFDHVMIPDVSYFNDAKNLYVALTRGSRSLKLLSKFRHIKLPQPFSADFLKD